MADQNNGLDRHEDEVIGKAYDAKLMKRLLSYARPCWKQFSIAIVLLALTTLTDLSRPYLIKIAIDDYMIRTKNPQAIFAIGLVYIGTIAAGFLFNYWQIYLLNFAGQTIIYDIRNQLFSHIQKMPLSFFDKHPVGRLVTRITNDTETLNEMYSNVLVNLLKDIFMLLGIVIILLKLNLKLALITLAFIPIIIAITVIFRSKARTIYRQVRSALSRINSVISENISGMRIIQVFNREREKLEEFKSVNSQYYIAGMKELVAFSLFRPSIEMLSFFSIAAIVLSGGSDVASGVIEFGVLYAFINYIRQFYQPINDLAEKYNVLQSAMVSSERIFMILDTEAEKDQGTIEIEGFKGDIEFKDVCFYYKDDQWVLKNVSFKVPAGKTVAIVGATGAGKTSIINLINRSYDIQLGEILIDGIDISKIKKGSLRKRIGIVLQDVFLFSGSIRENITLNEEGINSDEVKQVSEYVNADGFISRLTDGYDQEVMERGATLSSGQRQLLAFARALAFSPDILILDEATSSIDTETELLIQDALKKITKNRTTIVIAHRLSTIQHADSIIVLHKGRIKETGTHQELLAQRGMYYNLYNLQYIGKGTRH